MPTLDSLTADELRARILWLRSESLRIQANGASTFDGSFNRAMDYDRERYAAARRLRELEAQPETEAAEYPMRAKQKD